MATKLEIAVRQVFPTLVAAVDTPDAGPRNAELRERILARRAASPSMQASKKLSAVGIRRTPAPTTTPAASGTTGRCQCQPSA
jgi:hypothetical protein